MKNCKIAKSSKTLAKNKQRLGIITILEKILIDV
jgi:hypothetical protein